MDNRGRCIGGVSPVVAVILMVAITVILSAVIGTFVLDLGQQATSGSQTDIGVRTTTSDGIATVTVVTGTADQIKLLVNGTEVDNLTSPSVGDRLSTPVTDKSKLTVVSTSDGSTTVVLSETLTNTGLIGPTNGLIGYWRMDDSTSPTRAFDATSDSYGNISGAAYNQGQLGHSLSFNGTSDEVEINPESITLPTGSEPRTVVFWVYPINGGNGNAISWGDGTTTNARFSILFKNSEVGVIGEANDLKFYGHTPNKTWSHVAVTYNGSTTKIYVNGTEVVSASKTYDTTGTMPLMIGTNTDNRNDEYFEGRIDDARIYDRALSKIEINSHYNTTK